METSLETHSDSLQSDQVNLCFPYKRIETQGIKVFGDKALLPYFDLSRFPMTKIARKKVIEHNTDCLMPMCV